MVMSNLLFLGGIGGLEILLLFLIPVILWLWALIDCLKSNFSGSNKLIWIVLIIFLPVLGPILYLLIGRGQRV